MNLLMMKPGICCLLLRIPSLRKMPLLEMIDYLWRIALMRSLGWQNIGRHRWLMILLLIRVAIRWPVLRKSGEHLRHRG